MTFLSVRLRRSFPPLSHRSQSPINFTLRILCSERINQLAKRVANGFRIKNRTVCLDLERIPEKVLSDNAHHPLSWCVELIRQLSTVIPTSEIGYVGVAYNINWYPELRNYTLDIACQLLVGVSSGSQTAFGQWFEAWVQGIFSVPLRLPGTKFSRALRSRKLLLDEIERIARSRQQHQGTGQDSLGILMNARDEQFDPKRFDPARTGEDRPFGYAPFGGGVRECLGKEFARLEMKIFAALLVRDYEWNLVIEQNLDLEMIPSPRPKDGLKVHFRRRATGS